MHEIHEKEGLGPLPSKEKLHLGQKILKDKVWSKREKFLEVKSLERSREIEQNKVRINAEQIYRSSVILDS